MARGVGERPGGYGDLETKGKKFFKISHVKCCSGLNNMDGCSAQTLGFGHKEAIGNLENFL